jgi:hypothetical protein
LVWQFVPLAFTDVFHFDSFIAVVFSQHVLALEP